MSRLLTCTSETRPLEPLIGDTWLETDTGSIIVYGPIGWSVYSLGFITFPEELENNESNIQVYEVNINSNEGSVIGGGQYAAGNVVTLSATPNSGYLFDGWTVVSGGVTIINNSFTMPEGSVSITANYSIDASGPLGDSDGDGVLNQDDLYPNDSQRASGNDKDNDGIDDEFDTSYAVSITSSNGSVTGSGQKEVGSTVTLSSVPDAGYSMISWTVNSGGVTISNNSFTMPDDNVSITANYTAINYAVTVNGTNGAQSASAPGGNFNVGETVALSATPSTGYTFSSWTVNNGGITISNNSFTMPAGNVSITANYVIDSSGPLGDSDSDGVLNQDDLYPNDSQRASGNDKDNDGIDDEFDTSYAVSITSSNGSVTGAEQKTVGSTVTLSATPNTGYTFSGWTVNSGGITISNNSFTMPAEDVSITANYTAIDYTVTVGGSNGTESGGGTYNFGETVTLSATPNTGYTFSGWMVNSGGITISNNSFTMPAGNVSITANYTAIYYVSAANYGGTKELEMIWVEPGTFTMGQDGIAHEVTLTKGFYLGKYEVTQAQYEAVMTDNTDGLSATPSGFPGNPDRPVEKVSHNHVQTFLARLNEQQAGSLPAGWSYALPTEAQWEYACRAGTTTAYSWGDSMAQYGDGRANYKYAFVGNRTTDVGSYAANPWGFFDMHGNVLEWTADWYTAYSSEAQNDPEGPATGSTRVTRGGSWSSAKHLLPSSIRQAYVPSIAGWTIGFRVALIQSN